MKKMRSIKIMKLLYLVRIRIFHLSDLWLFIIAIILISTTSAAVGAFVSGMKPVDFFLGEENDILVISQPGTTTPMTSTIPVSLTTDVLKIGRKDNNDIDYLIDPANLNEIAKVYQKEEILTDQDIFSLKKEKKKKNQVFSDVKFKL